MNKKTTLLAVTLMIPIIAFSFRISNSVSENKHVDGAKIKWEKFNEGLARAKKENKILVIDFYTDWCHWCKVMEKDTYSNKKVIDYTKKKVVLAKINAETSQKFKLNEAEYSGRQLSVLFGVTGFPATVFMDSQGQLITTISGFIQYEKFLLILEYLAEEWYEKMEFDEFEKKKKTKNHQG